MIRLLHILMLAVLLGPSAIQVFEAVEQVCAEQDCCGPDGLCHSTCLERTCCANGLSLPGAGAAEILDRPAARPVLVSSAVPPSPPPSDIPHVPESI